MKSPFLLIRPARPEDVNAVYQLIQELAEYERAPQEVSNTPERMLADGFGREENWFGCAVAEQEDVIIGMAIWYFRYSTWKGRCLYLEDFYVKPEFRRTGIGAKLFEHVLAYAREQQCSRMVWQVLEWNEPAIRFYKKYNSHLDPEWLNGAIILDS
jgi:GNAT superfamily N-acetyltransferase